MAELTVFYLVRHAHADWSLDEMRPLSERGQTDALRVAILLAPYPVSAITSSPSRRAIETVSPLATRLGLVVGEDPDIRERTLSRAPVHVTEFRNAVRATWQDPTCAYRDGEPNSAAQRRGVAVVERLAAGSPGGHFVLGTHGNLLALILQHFDPSVDFDFWAAMTMPDVYRLNLSHSGHATWDHLWPGLNAGQHH